MATQDSGMAETMRRYHEYLEKNYEGGAERFFSPTGFLEKFQRTVKVTTDKVRNHVFVRSVDEAAQRLEDAIAGKANVFDLTAEPGTGKTSVLPFRFPTKKVVVALPTPFDAWNAFNMATGVCCLRIKGLKLGDQSSNVIYTDSYMASYALLTNFIDYDIMIVDECDSHRGVSGFLADVKTEGKLLIRMSASHGRKQAGLSRAFRVTEAQDMPDVRESKTAVAEYVRQRQHGRSILMAPDARTAKELHGKLPDSVLVTVESNFEKLVGSMLDQNAACLFVTDDTCGRALNLNLDMVFDTQLVVEFSDIRVLTPEEHYQRLNRVGRNKEGWYFSPGIKPKSKGISDFDTVRHNVARAVAEVDQEGEGRLQVSRGEADTLMCSSKEPYHEKLAMAIAESATLSSSSSNRSSAVGYATPSLQRTASFTSVVSKPESIRVKQPSWLPYFAGYTTPAADVGKKEIVDSFIVTNSRGEKAFSRRTSSESSSDRSGSRGRIDRSVSKRGGDDRSIMSALSGSFKGHSVVGNRAVPFLPVAKDAPYAVDRPSRKSVSQQIDIPDKPPIMDLTQLTYDLDWPALIKDRLRRGGDLPKLVPYGSWRHTSAGGLGTDWFARLEAMAYRDSTFDDVEFEVVARAYNKLVAQAWVRRTPGLSNASDTQRLEFCIRYFQSYYELGTVG